MTTEQNLQSKIYEMWVELRANGDVLVDAPGYRLGMPWSVPYEGVCFPVEIDGTFVFASIPTDQVARFAVALVALVPACIAMDAQCDAEMAAHEAIGKAQGV